MTHDYSKGPLARGPRGAFPRHSGPVTDIVEHYSWTVPDSGADMRFIERIHVEQNGWNGVGYHYGIHEDGRISYGRPEWARGAHVRGMNDRKIGVMWFGGRRPGSQDGHDTRTPAQKAALDRLYADIKTRHPIERIRGHRDYVATQCPGYDVQAWRAKKKQRPAQDATPAVTPVTRPAPPVKETPKREHEGGWGALFGRLAAWLGGRT